MVAEGSGIGMNDQRGEGWGWRRGGARGCESCNFFFGCRLGVGGSRVGMAGSVLGGWKGRRWSYGTPSENDWVRQGSRQGWRAGMAGVSRGKKAV